MQEDEKYGAIDRCPRTPNYQSFYVFFKAGMLLGNHHRCSRRKTKSGSVRCVVLLLRPLARVRFSVTCFIVGWLLTLTSACDQWPTFRAAEAPGFLTASGRIEGRITTVTPKSFGRVVELRVDEGQSVAAGDILVLLDDETQRQRVQAAADNLRASQQRLRAADTQLALLRSQVALQIKQATAAVREAQAKLERARANAAQAAKDAQRSAQLAEERVVPLQKAEHARLQAIVEEKAQREVEEGKRRADMQLALAQLGEQQIQAQSAERDALAQQVRQAEAVLAEQHSYVHYFTVRSPLQGTVLTRTVELGEWVTVGAPLFTLVDLAQLYMKVYIPEPQVGLVALGQEARVYVDAYPEQAFPARVTRVAQQAEFTPKNVETKEERVKLVFAVEVSLQENPGGVLKPGMPGDAVIRWKPEAPWRRP